jgi:hypothetical protein
MLSDRSFHFGISIFLDQDHLRYSTKTGFSEVRIDPETDYQPAIKTYTAIRCSIPAIVPPELAP